MVVVDRGGILPTSLLVLRDHGSHVVAAPDNVRVGPVMGRMEPVNGVRLRTGRPRIDRPDLAFVTFLTLADRQLTAQIIVFTRPALHAGNFVFFLAEIRDQPVRNVIRVVMTAIVAIITVISNETTESVPVFAEMTPSIVTALTMGVSAFWLAGAVLGVSNGNCCPPDDQ